MASYSEGWLSAVAQRPSTMNLYVVFLLQGTETEASKPEGVFMRCVERDH